MDFVSMFIGAIATILMVLIIISIFSDWSKIKTIELDLSKAELNKPFCPKCESYDLVKIDTADGVPWLKGHIKEVDYYQCKRCGHQFGDGD